MPHAELGGALARVRATYAYRGTVLALEFLVLTAERSGEVRKAAWDDVGVGAAVWTIPAEGMNTGREYRVPLADRALAVLDEARRVARVNDRVHSTVLGHARASRRRSASRFVEEVGDRRRTAPAAPRSRASGRGTGRRCELSCDGRPLGPQACSSSWSTPATSAAPRC